ncbi:MAG TPA: zinc-binding dehydrogenase [bacterium]|nr:zinc-binding dehydrogenase [bacterium]
METMRAARFVELGKMVFEKVPRPELQEGELLVRTELASICGSDLHIVYHGTIRTPFPQRPGYPGHEGVGEVIKSNHPDFQPGEKVLCCPNAMISMTFAEYQAIHGKYCIKLPESDLPISHLLMAQQFGTTIFALRQRPADVVGKTVMVMGQGSAGMFFAYLLKRAGAAKVITSDLSEARLAMGRKLGADLALQADRDDVKETVLEQTDGLGVEYLVEAVGSNVSLLQAVDLVRPDANMLMFGLPDTEKPVQYNFNDFFRKRLTMHSTYGAQEEPGLASFRMALDLILKKQIDVSPLVSHVFPIEKIQEAMETAHHRSSNALKVSVEF